MNQPRLQWGPTDRMRMRHIFIRLVELLCENDHTTKWYDWLWMVFEWIDGSFALDMYDKVVVWDYLRLIPPPLHRGMVVPARPGHWMWFTEEYRDARAQQVNGRTMLR